MKTLTRNTLITCAPKPDPAPACDVCGTHTGPFIKATSTPHPETGEDPETTTYCKGCAPCIGPDEEDFTEDLKPV